MRNSWKKLASNFSTDLVGATAIEYALIAGGISIVIVGVVALLGGNLANMYDAIATALG